MALAPVAYCLWQQFLRFDPGDLVSHNRDRFVLSIGHASMLLYSLLHLTEVRAASKDYEILGETGVLNVARNRELTEARNISLDVRTISAICRGLAQEPSLISLASKALLGYIGDRRRVQIIVSLLWALVRDESPEVRIPQ
jgi:hypothetical protein